MAIIFQAEDVKEPAVKKRAVSAWIKKVAKLYNRQVGDVSYIFCSDDKILEVNKQYLKHDYFTDVITFDYSENDTISGDIFISLDTVKSNSQKFNTSNEEELLRVIIHGILHLCGLKDKSAEDSKMMTKSENQALEIYQKDNNEKTNR